MPPDSLYLGMIRISYDNNKISLLREPFRLLLGFAHKGTRAVHQKGMPLFEKLQILRRNSVSPNKDRPSRGNLPRALHHPKPPHLKTPYFLRIVNRTSQGVYAAVNLQSLFKLINGPANSKTEPRGIRHDVLHGLPPSRKNAHLLINSEKTF
jgi:hypothetical protein